MDFTLIFRTARSLFSFNPKNMRFFNFKRVFAILIFLPLFLINLIGNRIFMMLDYLFFFKFTRLKIDKSVFIVAVPRSATTYLFHKLANQRDKTTAMKLWEIAYAPSIIQKYI